MTLIEARAALADAGLSPEAMDEADGILRGSGDELSEETIAAISVLLTKEREKIMAEMRTAENDVDAMNVNLSEMTSDIEKATMELEDVERAVG